MSVREVPADDPTVVELAAAQQTELNVRYGGGMTADEIDRVRSTPQPPLSPQAHWLLLDDHGQAVGCVAVQPLAAHHGRPNTGEVKRLFVRADARGRGHSRALMAAAEDLGRNLGFTDLWLETGVKQPEAMSLYETSGWTPIAPYGYWHESPSSRAFAKIL